MRQAGKKAETRSSTPTIAAWLTWFVPGAGHVFIGKPLTALIGFALVEGLYLAGLKLSDGLAFEFLQPDLRTTFAPALTPEVGNLGALIWHRRQHPFLPPSMALPWPETIQLGALLTALSGFLNVCLMVRAHVDARLGAGRRLREPSPSTLVFLAWLVPGLAHWLQGRRLRAAAVFVLVVGLFALGTMLAEGSNLDRERHFYYWGGQFLLGLPAIVAEAIHGHARVTGDIAYADAGLVFGCVAGLLNVLAMIDVFGFREKELFAQGAEPERTALGAGAKT